MKEAVIIKIAANKYSSDQAKAQMIKENPGFTYRGMRSEPIDGFWTAMFEKQANPFPSLDDTMDTTNTSDSYGDSGELDVDAPTPSDEFGDEDDMGGEDDIKSVLADLKDTIMQLKDAVESMNGGDDHSEPDGDELDMDFDDDVSFDDGPSADEVDDAPSQGKFVAKAPKKLYRPKEAGIGIRQARSELLREMSQMKEYRNYRIASLEDVGNRFEATLELKRPSKKRRNGSAK